MFWLVGCEHDDAVLYPSGNRDLYDVGSDLYLHSDNPETVQIGYHSDSPECADSADNDADGGEDYTVGSWNAETGVCQKTDAECAEDFDNSENLLENTLPDAYVAANLLYQTDYELLKESSIRLKSSWAPAVEFRINAPSPNAPNLLQQQRSGDFVHVSGTVTGDLWIPEYDCGITGVEVYLSTAFPGYEDPSGRTSYEGEALQNDGSFTLAGEIDVEEYSDKIEGCGILMQAAGFDLEDYDTVYMAFRLYDPSLKDFGPSTDEPLPCTPAD